jgi:hypothetical protein
MVADRLLGQCVERWKRKGGLSERQMWQLSEPKCRLSQYKATHITRDLLDKGHKARPWLSATAGGLAVKPYVGESSDR